jgi:hypothetical protein
MPVVIAWIGEMLLSVVGQLAFSVLVSLGIAMVANTGASVLIDHTQIGNAFAASGLTQWIGFFGVDKGMTIVRGLVGRLPMLHVCISLLNRRLVPDARCSFYRFAGCW